MEVILYTSNQSSSINSNTLYLKKVENLKYKENMFLCCMMYIFIWDNSFNILSRLKADTKTIRVAYSY